MEHSSANGHPAMRHRLLIVDDEAKICDLLSQYFSLRGYEVRTVRGGEEALVLAESFQPHAILLDLLMPGLGGVETLKRLKQVGRNAKILMLSSADHDDVVEGALALGADFYICKPPNLHELEQLINGFLPSSNSTAH